MYIGLGIVLLVLGAILGFDVVTVDSKYVDEHALGWILMIAGVVAIVLSLSLRDRYSRRTVVAQPPAQQTPVVEERREI